MLKLWIKINGVTQPLPTTVDYYLNGEYIDPRPHPWIDCTVV